MTDDLKNAVSILQQGGVILYPTDTIWGLGCDATNEKAVQRIFEIKKRIDTKAMLVLLDSAAKIQTYVSEMPEIAWDLIELSEKPLTIIYPQAKNLASNLVGEDKSIGIRITRELFSKSLCERFRKPIVSTSANLSGEKSPLNFSDISDEIISKVDYVVKYKQEEICDNAPSSIIKIDSGNVIKIIRA
ncbi:MAG: threonylcarbamoyl-AMP synthase [Paludibacteraceae bacterium]|nr:threonylcarbamoyl-AMP synthase [Paludibacteraceae bacterium]MBN2788178.1 threonylcarbamoyl-AMP synthase [Paludibacteraceae bacterium]